MDHAPPAGTTPAEPVRFSSPAGRWVLLASILGSGLAGIDATVVNVALPAIGRDLEADLAGLQWTITGYALSLASLILLGGALGDHYGRRRVFVIGVVWFAVASLGCAVAPSVEVLVAARFVQGIGGALLTPGSLAIIQASFAPADRAKAIGAWGAGATALEGRGLSGSPGVVIADNPAAVFAEIQQLMATHRVWERFPATVA